MALNNENNNTTENVKNLDEKKEEDSEKNDVILEEGKNSLEKTQKNEENNETYDLNKDYKFLSILQFVNLFHDILNLEPISTNELEFSLNHTDIEPLCINILSKLLMKKENMRTSKLNKEQNKSTTNLIEAPSNNNSNLNNEQKNPLNNINVIPKEKNAFSEIDINKLNENLFKKINFFYKTYIRYLRKAYNITDLSNIFEIIKTDIDNFKNRADPFALTRENLNYKCYDNIDIKTMLIINFFRELGGNNPLHRISSIQMMEKMLSNKEDDFPEESDYVPFSLLSIENKVNFLYFFCIYCMTFSGRAQIFKDEMNKNKNENFISNRRIMPLFSDKLGNDYYIFPNNKDCRIYKDKIDVENPIENNLENNIKNYEDLEKFLEKETNNQIKKKINEHLLEFKNNDEEEKKKQNEFLKKEQMIEKKKKVREMNVNSISEVDETQILIMSNSSGVTTRLQLNNITNSIQKEKNTNQKPKELTEEEKRKQKIIKENYERDKRMEKRNRIHEQILKDEEYKLKHNGESMFGKKKRNRNKKKKKHHKNSWSDDEEDEYNEQLENEMNIESDDDDEYTNGRKHKTNNKNYYNGNNYYDGSYEVSERGNEDKNVSQDIINEGYLLYRYSSNQIEIEGYWYVNDEPSIKERISYLFTNSNSVKNVIMPIENNNVNVTICSANLIEDFSIDFLFKECLSFLSGEYAGYFMYYSKTIEDRFKINLEIEDSLVKLYGNGSNNLGAFNVNGYMNFFRTKEVLLEKNKIEEPVIKLAEFSMKKVYNQFNPTENERVIKSYNHRRKKNDDDNY